VSATGCLACRQHYKFFGLAVVIAQKVDVELGAASVTAEDIDGQEFALRQACQLDPLAVRTPRDDITETHSASGRGHAALLGRYHTSHAAAEKAASANVVALRRRHPAQRKSNDRTATVAAVDGAGRQVSGIRNVQVGA
jgi:hypothetical protein